MKILYFISGLTLLNLFAVTAIANYPIKDSRNTFQDSIIVSPTPIVVVKKVINKVKVQASNRPLMKDLPKNLPVIDSNSQIQVNPIQPVVNPTPQPVVSGCIVILDGAQYNVNTLKNTHSGGDIFSCGTDMSSTFWSKHGQSIFNKMQKYRI